MVLNLEQLTFLGDTHKQDQLPINTFLVLDTKTIALMYQRKANALILVTGVNTVSDPLMDCYS